MKKITTMIICLIAGATFSCYLSRPQPGEITETYETANQSFKIRVNRHAEINGGFVGGAYYVFQSAAIGSDSWQKVMTFRHDDPVEIQRDHLRFINNQIGYAFMGWTYAVTTDSGHSWFVWNAEKELPRWQCCNYRLIEEVNLAEDGKGTMKLSPIPGRSGEVHELQTMDYGKHWNAAQ